MISSSNYPHLQPDDQECRFLLRADKPNSQLSLRFIHLFGLSMRHESNLSSDACDFAFASVYEGAEEKEHKRIGRY